MTGSETAANRLPKRARGYSRFAVRNYLARITWLRDKGFAPAGHMPPGGFRWNWLLRGYDPEGVDKYLAELMHEAAATGLRRLPALPFSAEVGRPTRRQHQADSDWRLVGDLPGARLSVERSKLGNVFNVKSSSGGVLLTRRFGTMTLATGQVLHLDRPGGVFKSLLGHKNVTDSGTGQLVSWVGFYEVLFPGQRYLAFPVSGTKLDNAVMTAVNESGTAVLWFRRIPKGIIEVVVSPDCELTTDMLCVIAVAAKWLLGYFSSGGG